MSEQTQEQQTQQPEQNPTLTLQLSVSEINQVIAGLENLTKPLLQKIVSQAKAQLGQE